MTVIPLHRSGYTPREERMLRELGISVAALWHRLPVEVKAVILNQAETGMRSELALAGLQELHSFLGTYTLRHRDVEADCASKG
jgi:hypothetical protein